MNPDLTEVTALLAQPGGGDITFDWLRQVGGESTAIRELNNS